MYPENDLFNPYTQWMFIFYDVVTWKTHKDVLDFMPSVYFVVRVNCIKTKIDLF